jgi:hypothetical protein
VYTKYENNPFKIGNQTVSSGGGDGGGLRPGIQLCHNIKHIDYIA